MRGNYGDKQLGPDRCDFLRLNVMDLSKAAGADSTKLLMEIKHGGDPDSYINARARQGLTFDCEALSHSVFGRGRGTGTRR